jgi:hypothetical protein
MKSITVSLSLLVEKIRIIDKNNINIEQLSLYKSVLQHTHNVLPIPSIEQYQIFNLLLKGRNIIIDSVAGSGKTTTILYIGKILEKTGFKILVLTYNKNLRLDTYNKVSILKLENTMDIYTYHSFGYNCYDRRCSNDVGLEYVLKNNIKQKKNILYDIFIIDESQDICPLYFYFIRKVIHDFANKNFKIVLLGDGNQCIYSFREADERFLQYSDVLLTKIKKNESSKWIRAELSTTYRFGDKISFFINKCVLGIERINSYKLGGTVKYVICNTYVPDSVYNILYDVITKYQENDIFILTPSTKYSYNVRNFSNLLTEKGYNIYVLLNDESPLKKEVMENKIVITTFHKVKGLERKVVIVFHFDESYYSYNKSASKKKCPNELYVAITRPTEKLILLHDYKKDYLPFLNVDKLKSHTKYIEVEKMDVGEQNRKRNKKRTYSVTDLINHIPPSISNKCFSLIKFKIINKKEEIIKINPIIKVNTLYEDVSDITGIAIPFYYEYEKTRSITSLIGLKEYEDNKNNINNTTILMLANIFSSKKTGYKYRLKQIKIYNWLSQSNLEKSISRLDRHIEGNIECEQKVVCMFTNNIKIEGYIDCIDKSTIWEFKCTSDITFNHILQLVIYSYVFKHSKRTDKTKIETFKILNIITGEIFEVFYNDKNIKQVITILLDHKISCEDNKEKKDDKEFVNDIKNDRFFSTH